MSMFSLSLLKEEVTPQSFDWTPVRSVDQWACCRYLYVVWVCIVKPVFSFHPRPGVNLSYQESNPASILERRASCVYGHFFFSPALFLGFS